ncbi:MAG: outer membrane lipoprotein LolB [Chromatiales bacterium]|nr:outer membrane lipoprotein LolB [Chromatiales bacterium]
MPRLLPLALALLLGACAVRPPAPVSPDSWAARNAQLAVLPDWGARGRVAVRGTDGSGGQGSLAWEQEGEQAQIRLAGPFGAGAWEIRWDSARLTVAGRGGEVALDYTGPDAADRFLHEQLGWWFPAVAARYWLRGLPAPGAPFTEEFDGFGRLARIEQHGWSISYEDWHADASWLMPRRLVMQSARGRVRVVVDSWAL